MTDNVPRHRITFACLRAIKGVSAAEVARKTNLCPQTIRNLRRPVSDGGTMFPRLHTIAKIASGFGYDLAMVEKSEVKRLAARQQHSLLIN